MLACMALLYACSRAEIKEREYANYSEVRSKGQLGNWIPKWLPNSAIEIREKHNVDSTTMWMTYIFNKADNHIISKHCTSMLPGGVSYPRLDILHRINNFSWPKELLDESSYLDYRYRYIFYICGRKNSGEIYWMAIKPENKQLRAYLWSH